jgi:hypothetical protein
MTMTHAEIYARFRDAYQAWAESDPDSCRCDRHWWTRPKGDDLTVRVIEDKPDSLVCERERLWRMYISYRDGKNYCVSG